MERFYLRMNTNDLLLTINYWGWHYLTHWGWVKHKCISTLTTIGSDNDLLPGRHQPIMWTNAGILLIGLLGINFSEILIELNTFSFRKMHFKMVSANWCLCLNVLSCKITYQQISWSLRAMWVLKWPYMYGIWQGSTLRVFHLSNPTWFVLGTSWVDNLVVQF